MSDPNTTPPPFGGEPGQMPPSPPPPGHYSSPDAPPPAPESAPPGPPQYQPPQYQPPQPQYGAPQQPQYGAPQYGTPQQPQYGAPQYGAPQYQQPAAQAYVPGYGVEGWVPELGVQIGSAGTRIGAKSIDIIFYLIIQFALGIGAAGVLLASSASDDLMMNQGFTTTGGSLVLSLGIGVVLLGVDFLYNVVCTARFGGTPGKLILGLKVICTDGRPVDFRTAFIRWTPILGLAVLALVPIVGVLASIARLALLIANLVMVLTDERRRDVFDRVASTYVVTSR